MPWTKEKPTRDGYYCYRTKPGDMEIPMQVLGQSVLQFGIERTFPLSKLEYLNGEWLGPWTAADVARGMDELADDEYGGLEPPTF